MNKEELRTLVSEILRDYEKTPVLSTQSVSEPVHQVPDITAMDLRKLYMVERPANHDEFLQLKSKTPARLGNGRAGARYKTLSMLRFRADHAAAQDSVFSQVSKEFVEKNHLVFVKTRCTDKDEYLTRPDLGRRFDGENQKIIEKTCGKAPKILLVIGDGLSSAAIEANGMDCSNAIRQGLKAHGHDLGDTLFIQYCRVGASDHIGQMTGADLVCMLVGERPGLVTAESMSAYITYRPRIGTPESDRTVISNIHKQGTPAVEAGAHIATLLLDILQKGCSGVKYRQEAVG
ncbi:MAG: ethanolamine ammonia-lyase subunit EutC [Eubacteriales bacterium]